MFLILLLNMKKECYIEVTVILTIALKLNNFGMRLVHVFCVCDRFRCVNFHVTMTKILNKIIVHKILQ